MDLITLAMAKAYTDSKTVAVEKAVLHEGTPTKTDLSSVGFGYAYILSDADLISLAKGQIIHYEFEAGGNKYSGKFSDMYWQSALATPYFTGKLTQVGEASGYPFLIYNTALGGTGFQLSMNVGLDIGDITNFKLWIEYSGAEPFFITGYYTADGMVYYPTEQDKAMAAAENGQLMIKWLNACGVPTISHPCYVSNYDTYFEAAYFSTGSTIEKKNIKIADGQPTAT